MKNIVKKISVLAITFFASFGGANATVENREVNFNEIKIDEMGRIDVDQKFSLITDSSIDSNDDEIIPMNINCGC